MAKAKIIITFINQVDFWDAAAFIDSQNIVPELPLLCRFTPTPEPIDPITGKTFQVKIGNTKEETAQYYYDWLLATYAGTEGVPNVGLDDYTSGGWYVTHIEDTNIVTVEHWSACHEFNIATWLGLDFSNSNITYTFITSSELCVHPDPEVSDLSYSAADSDQCNKIKATFITSTILKSISEPIVINPNTSDTLTFTVDRGVATNVIGIDSNNNIFNYTIPAIDLLDATKITYTFESSANQTKLTIANLLPSLELQYNLDGGTWQTLNIFYLPLDSSYTLYIKDQYGCEINKPISIGIEYSREPKTVQKRYCGGLHELNKGKYLNLCNKQYTMKIGFVCNASPQNVKIFKHLQMILNTDYPVKNISITTSLDQERFIPGNHMVYRIRESMHSVPLKNPNDWADLRGSWAYLEIEIESINNKKVDLFSAITHLRKSII